MEIVIVRYIGDVRDFIKDKKIISIQRIDTGFMIVFKEKILSKIIKTILNRKSRLKH